MKPEQTQVLVFGAQLTGLSPTFCRRLIAGIRSAIKDANPEHFLSPYVNGLMNHLGEQTKIYELNSSYVSRSDLLEELLAEAERFLDVVEDKAAPPAEEPPK